MRTFTKKQVEEELKKLVQKKQSISSIGNWAYRLFLKKIEDIDSKFNKLLLDLGTMGLGPEFEYSYEQLNMIADKLITGEDVSL